MSILLRTDKDGTYIKVDNDVYDHFVQIGIMPAIVDRVPMITTDDMEQTLLSYIFNATELINTKPKYNAKDNSLIYDYTTSNCVFEYGYAFKESVEADLMSELRDKIISEVEDPLGFVDDLRDLLSQSNAYTSDRVEELLGLIQNAEEKIIKKYAKYDKTKFAINRDIAVWREELESLD